MPTRGYGKVKDIDLGWKHIQEQAAILKKKPVAVVGIRGEAKKDTVDAQGNVTKADATLVTIATVHEYGSSSRGIPERSYIRSTVDANRGKYRRMLESFRRHIFNPTSTLSIREALLLLGTAVSQDIKNKIRSGLQPPWASSTRAERVRRANGAIVAETPLIDTGQLINGITNEAEFKNGSRL